MAEYSRGSFNGRLRDWRSRRAEARAVARWPTPATPAPEPPRAEDPLAARWVPDCDSVELAASAAAATPTLAEPSRWLTAGPETATEPAEPGAQATSVLTAPAPGAADWLPQEVMSEKRATRADGDSSRWVPAPESAEDEPNENVDQRQAAAEAYCRVLCEPAAVAAATAEALEMADDNDASLLRATRTAAAARAVPVATPTTWRQRLAAEHEHPCAATYHRLAERANGTLSSREERELEQHLSGCAQCRDASERERRATEAFVAVLPAATAYEDLDPDAARWAPPGAGAAVAATGAVAAGAAATASTGFAATAAATPAAKAAPLPAAQPRRRRRRPLALLAGAACLAAVIAVAAVLLIKSNNTTHHATTPNTQGAVQTRTATTPSRAKASTTRHHKKTVVHHKAAAHHKAAHHKTKAAVHKATHPAVSTPVTRPVTPVYVAPVIRHTVTPAAPVQPTGTKVSTVSEPSLPKESAPQSGVGKPGK